MNWTSKVCWQEQPHLCLPLCPVWIWLWILPCFNVMDNMRDISQAQSSYSLQLTSCLHQMLKTRMCGPFLCVLYWSWLIFKHQGALVFTFTSRACFECSLDYSFFWNKVLCFVLFDFPYKFQNYCKAQVIDIAIKPLIVVLMADTTNSILFWNIILIDIRKWALEMINVLFSLLWKNICVFLTYFEK